MAIADEPTAQAALAAIRAHSREARRCTEPAHPVTPPITARVETAPPAPAPEPRPAPPPLPPRAITPLPPPVPPRPIVSAPGLVAAEPAPAAADPAPAAAEPAPAAAQPAPPLAASPRPDISARAAGFGQLALARVLDPVALDRARRLQQRAGGSLISVLTSAEHVDPNALALALAHDTGLARVHLEDVDYDPEVLGLVDEADEVQHLFVPLGHGPSGVRVAVADPFDPAVRDIVRDRIPGPTEFVIATEAEITATLGQAWGPANVHEATSGFNERHPDICASVVITGAQKLFAAAVILLFVIAAVIRPLDAFIAVNILSAIFYVSTSAFRLRLVNLATNRPKPEYDHRSLEDLDERQLPMYTILVPMYKEAAVVPRVARSLGQLDYPAHKLDVLMICEEDDDETIAAVEGLGLGSQFRLIVVPDARPKTKPKACNYALHHARGEMVVIFDAEDAPDPDQLKRVLLTLRDAPANVACVQAKLDYGNAEQNTLTRWFAAEYAMWFDLILPGLEAFDAPIPLGGTSNHFRTEVLRELGGWDPFNVTEDADLGVRLYKLGYKTMIVDSTTMEEANSQVPNWIRQRSRWMKGHIQTWLVHTRHPLKARRELGWRGFLGFQLTIGGSCFAALLNPFYWAMILLWFATRANLLREVFPSFVYYAASINLLVWNFAFVYAAAAGVARRGYFTLVRAALYSPLYWVLISIAAWKGALQLITNPFYWEKTVHGLDQPATAVDAHSATLQSHRLVGPLTHPEHAAGV